MIIFATIQVTKTPIKYLIFYTRENSEVLWQSWIISMLGKFLLGPKTSASTSSAHIWYEWHGTASYDHVSWWADTRSVQKNFVPLFQIDWHCEIIKVKYFWIHQNYLPTKSSKKYTYTRISLYSYHQIIKIICLPSHPSPFPTPMMLTLRDKERNMATFPRTGAVHYLVMAFLCLISPSWGHTQYFCALHRSTTSGTATTSYQTAVTTRIKTTKALFGNQFGNQKKKKKKKKKKKVWKGRGRASTWVYQPPALCDAF